MTEKVNILMVDDQPGKLLTYEAILGDLGENLIKANSSREALDQLLKHEIAVVLMDVSMPEMNGFDLAAMIRQHPRYQKTAIIFISAVHLTDIDKLTGYARGAVDYVSVPFVPELLRAKVAVFAELHRKARQMESLNAELRRLSSMLISTQDEERRRIARDLHDGLGQDLTAVKLMVESIIASSQASDKMYQAAIDLRTLAERMIQDIRNMSYLLHPPMLDEIGLNFALSWYLDGFSKRSGINTTLEITPREFPRLSSDMETAIFRVVQEALTNVLRHAKAQSARVQLSRSNSEVCLIVKDDGKGVSEDILECKPGSLGVGIAGMKQRVKEFGGDLQLHHADPGTVIEVTIPLSSDTSSATIQSLAAH